MGYYHPIGKQSKLAKKYGVEGVNSPRPGMEGGAMGNRRTVNDVERDIRGAMMDDYDTREFLKYNDDIREEANEQKNLRDQNNFIHDAMKDAHKEAGNGGKFSSSNDFAGVAQNAFENYEDTQRTEQRGYVDEQIAKMKAEMPADTDTGAAESAAANMTYGEYLKNKDGGQSAKAGAQKMAGDTIKSIASNRGAIAKGKAKQGQYVLANLGSDEYQGGK